MHTTPLLCAGLPSRTAQPVAVRCSRQGTVGEEQQELSEAYGLDVLRVPPHRPSRRIDLPLDPFIYEDVGWARHQATSSLRLQRSWDAQGDMG